MRVFKIVIKYSGIVIGILVTLLIVTVLLLVACRKPMFSKFYAQAEKTVVIPGLDQPYCPQGLAYVPEDDVYIFSGYMTDGTNSKLFVSGSDTVKEISLSNSDGTNYLGHAGGVAKKGDKIYIADGSKIDIISYNALMSAEDKSSLKIEISKPVKNNASFVFADDYYLWVGDFYMPKKYETRAENHFTSQGQDFKAIAEAYEYDDDSPTGLKEQSSLTLSLPNQVQGLCMTSSGKFVVSISYGIKNSRLVTYEAVLNTQTPQDSHYYLYDSAIIENIAVMPMSEDLDYHNGRVYINFESACKKYSLFNIYPSENVYTYRVD